MYVAGGVLQKERKESVCRGRSVAEGERGECMSREECCGRREESVCRWRSDTNANQVYLVLGSYGGRHSPKMEQVLGMVF